MKQAGALIALLIVVFVAMDASLGWMRTYLIAHGAFTLISLVISGTFLWLYLARATPLALGMCLSWAGVAGIVAWRWAFYAFDAPQIMSENALLFVFLAVHYTGAMLHLSVILRSMEVRAWWMILPLTGSIGLAGAVGLMI